MYKIVDHTIKISVRNIVEFILRGGNIDTSAVKTVDTDAMQIGSKIHRKIQKSMGPEYQAEVPLSITVPAFAFPGESQEYVLTIEGRADGVIQASDQTPVTIDEIKAIYMELGYLKEPIPVHLAQAKCYAYIYAVQNALETVQVRLSYCNIETMSMKYFEQSFPLDSLTEWFTGLTKEFSKWIQWQCTWNEKRNQSIKGVEFPFPYREGQKEIVAGVYKTILRKKKLYIEAPTGVGKTISTVFPSIKAMGEGLLDKVFYMTAKTITRTAAQDAFKILKENGMQLKVTTITAKDKFCVLDEMSCNPTSCERAKGHYDRVNDAVYDLITNENEISRELILEYSKKHRVCPFEMCLDVTNWSDAVICDYNYVFDPNVYLRRFFSSEAGASYVFLIDEAHNLVERAREMYSASLYKQTFLDCKKIVLGYSNKLAKRLEVCNKSLLKLKRDCDEFKVVDSIEDFVYHAMQMMTEMEEFLVEYKSIERREECLSLYFEVRHFLNMYEIHDENYTIYTDYDSKQGFRLRLQCMNPANNLKACLEKGRSAIFYSATLLPIHYYKEQLGGGEQDYAIYAPSPFLKENRLLLIGDDVSTKYSRRTKSEFEKIAHYIFEMVKSKVGNYMVFLPSYQYLKEIHSAFEQIVDEHGLQVDLVLQHGAMSEKEKEEFLEGFVESPKQTRIGLCVMGGIFSEGIDLRGSRLIGVAIVGTGLPMVCNERELFRTYYDEVKGNGFHYSYLYNGMNKVLQSAGRVIRTANDIGVILLLDERFKSKQYQELFPREWYPHAYVKIQTVGEHIKRFWDQLL